MKLQFFFKAASQEYRNTFPNKAYTILPEGLAVTYTKYVYV